MCKCVWTSLQNRLSGKSSQKTMYLISYPECLWEDTKKTCVISGIGEGVKVGEKETFYSITCCTI